MLNIESVYKNFLDLVNEEHNKGYVGFEGWFRASSAGQCYRKQFYELSGAEKDQIDSRPQRVMRLGTIVHEDIGCAITTGYINTEKSYVDLEERIEIPDLRIVGHPDIVQIENDIAYLYDIKTMHSFAWKRRFGHAKNRDPKPSRNYELQLGTYAIGVRIKYDISKINAYIMWYKKDDSSIKINPIDVEKWMRRAELYWEELIEMTSELTIEDLVPGQMIGVPFQNWECRYCSYKGTCPGGKKR
jgi:CRISPR/Cas system-associated exonuclease Cas4 (RecB family)|tara:strand:- start:3426 stop:4157 length:732 start_codon:yes stop_codon:yes gene_type:complete